MLISYLVTLRKAPRRGAGESADDVVAHNMLTYNCFECHTRDRIGGVEFARDERFQTTELSGGDEVRIPPPIDGVGAKFKEDWLLNILSSGANDRPYMLTRMPGFGAANAGEMAKLFAAIDHVEPLASEPLDPIEAKRVGRQLVGDKGFACTTCHNFGRYEAPRIRAMDLVGVTERLREDWFRRYLRDPQVYRPGTQMPSAWPATGVSMFDDLLDGDSDKQIHAMWEYLSDGELAKTPSGLGITR